MVQLFNEYFIFCLDIAPAKTHGIAPKEDYSYSEGYVCFDRYGDVIIILSHFAYSAEIVFWASGHEEEVHEAEEVRIWTVNLSL